MYTCISELTHVHEVYGPTSTWSRYGISTTAAFRNKTSHIKMVFISALRKHASDNHVNKKQIF